MKSKKKKNLQREGCDNDGEGERAGFKETEIEIHINTHDPSHDHTERNLRKQ